MEKLGLVLSGGGSKGAYEIGVYKALRKMHMKIDIVTGTSIGAINGIFIVQKSLRKALKFWRHISFSAIYREEDFSPLEDDKLKTVYKQYLKTFINEGGMDVVKMEKIFDKYFKPYKFFTSNIDYGLVTFNFTKKKPLFVTKDKLTPQNTKAYVLASASCFPAFKPYVIDKDLYIDGGYYDNIPINLAIDRGATKIIAVDLRAVGFKKNIKDKSVEVTYIAPRNKIASFLIFDKNKAREAIKFGYNDAMKTFGKLDGDKFTFKKNSLIKNYNKYNNKFEDNLNAIFKKEDNILLKKIFSSSIFKEILNRQTLYNSFNNIVEKSGKIFNFEEYTIYGIHSYNKGLLNALSSVSAIDIEIIKNSLKNKKLRDMLDSKKIVKYFYNCIIKKDKTMIKYIPLFSDEFLSALYIYTVKGLKITY